MAPSSSASKVAKLAQKGKGKKVRFQGGTVFPAVIVGVLALLLPLIVYARESRPGPGEGQPTINQHWHAAFGMYVCDENGLLELPVLSGNLEDPAADGASAVARYSRTGVHSHDDGVMHWHPSTGAATGTNAKLKVFIDNYDITLTNSKLALPANQGGQVYEEGKTTCKIDGQEKDATVQLWVWDTYTNVKTADPAVYLTNMRDVRLRNDGMVFVIAFVPEGVDPVAPEYASNLLELGAADTGGAPNPDLVIPDSTTAGTGPTSDTSTADTGTAGTSTADTGTADTGTDDTTTASSAATTATTGG